MRKSYAYLDDDQLHTSTIKASKAEKTATVDLLDHLYEVNLRRLYAKKKYGSNANLKSYIVKQLGYTDYEAKMRIAAMKLLERAPKKIRSMLENGKLAFTNAALINRHLDNNNVPEDQVMNVICELADKSSRTIIQETSKAEGRGLFLHEGICEKIKRLGWTDLNDSEIFEALLEEKIRREKCEKSERLTTVDLEDHNRYIPVRTMEIVMKRSGHKCEYPGCTARHNLEWNHIVAYANGGGRGPDNIELLCWGHNQRQAVEDFEYSRWRSVNVDVK